MQEKNKSNIDKLVGKYISVWLWSIIFGVTVTISYNLVRAIPYESNYDYSYLIVLILSVVTIIKIVVSWKNLFLFLNQYIIPKNFSSDEKEVDITTLNKKSIYLTNAFDSLLTSVILLFAIKLYPIVIDVLQSIIYQIIAFYS